MLTPRRDSQASHPAGASQFVRGERLTAGVCVGQGERLIANGRRQANQFQSGNDAGVTRLQRRLRWHLARPNDISQWCTDAPTYRASAHDRLPDP